MIDEPVDLSKLTGVTEPSTASETTPENPWPVRRLSENMKTYIDRAPATWVEGQLIEFKLSRGHAWMTLRDVDQDYSLPVTAWKSVASTFDPSIAQGSRVVAYVKPDFYTKTGRLNMIARAMRPVGIGELLARIEMLRRVLGEEGLFDPALKKPLPVLPNRIGLITGRDSDAMKDVMRNVHLRWEAAEFEVRPVAVQGAGAAQDVIRALQELDAHPEVDVIIIARGGGALEEVILPFSDEALIRAVATARTPVVSAIGHENDNPVLDNVADLRASTPTDAAKRVVPDAEVERAGITDARRRMAGAVERLVYQHTQHLEQIRSRPVLTQPERTLELWSEEIGALVQRARAAFGHRLDRAEDQIAGLRTQVKALSPQQTLDRGYAVVQHAGSPLRDASTVAVGDQLDILLASGRIAARAEKITPGPEHDAG